MNISQLAQKSSRVSSDVHTSMFVALFSSDACIYFGVLVEVLELVFDSVQILATFFFQRKMGF